MNLRHQKFVKIIHILKLISLGTSLLVTAQIQWPPRPGDEAQKPLEASLDNVYLLEIKPLKAKLAGNSGEVVKGNLEARKFIPGKLWKRGSRQSFDED